MTFSLTELAQQPWLTAATASLVVFAVVAAIDGVYVHLWKLRLHTRRESYAEHLWHTASAVLFVPMVAALFVAEPRGIVLWLGLAILAATHAVEVFDVRAERTSRRALGGLSRAELGVHVAAVITRTAAVGLLLASLPAAAWSLGAVPGSAFAAPFASAPALLGFVSGGLLWGAVAVAVLHIGLAVRHCPLCPAFAPPSSPAAGA